MENEIENKEVNGVNTDAQMTESPVNAEMVVGSEGIVKKIVKKGLKVLAFVATGVAGFVLGRVTSGGDSDDDDNESGSEEETTTEE